MLHVWNILPTIWLECCGKCRQIDQTHGSLKKENRYGNNNALKIQTCTCFTQDLDMYFVIEKNLVPYG